MSTVGPGGKHRDAKRAFGPGASLPAAVWGTIGVLGGLPGCFDVHTEPPDVPASPQARAAADQAGSGSDPDASGGREQNAGTSPAGSNGATRPEMYCGAEEESCAAIVSQSPAGVLLNIGIEPCCGNHDACGLSIPTGICLEFAERGVPDESCPSLEELELPPTTPTVVLSGGAPCCTSAGTCGLDSGGSGFGCIALQDAPFMLPHPLNPVPCDSFDADAAP